MIRLPVFTFFSCLIACSSRPEFPVQVQNIPEKGWHADSVVRFSFRVSQTGDPVDFLYQVRYREPYPFENIYLAYCLTGPRKDTLIQSKDNLFLFETRTGKPLGWGSRKGYYLDAYFLRKVTFPDTGMYHLQVRQAMRRQILPGIESLGLKIKRPGDS